MSNKNILPVTKMQNTKENDDSWKSNINIRKRQFEINTTFSKQKLNDIRFQS